MGTFWSVVQWLLAGSGLIGVIYAYVVDRRLNIQRHDLDKMKTKFDYLIIERNKILTALNSRVSDIELWLAKTKRYDDYSWMNTDEYRELLNRLEVTLIHGRYLLTPDVFSPVNKLYEQLRECLRVYDDELEKEGNQSVELPPQITFSNMLFDKRISELINTVKIRIGKELKDE